MRKNYSSKGISPSQYIQRIIEDTVSRERDVRSGQGSWGVFSLDLITRATSFETAVVTAFAPFYNPDMY
jgi:non-canonical (house-cleaning) NTP pyrophosphatase